MLESLTQSLDGDTRIARSQREAQRAQNCYKVSCQTALCLDKNNWVLAVRGHKLS